MSLIPIQNLANQLEPAWAFLSGHERHFVPAEVQPPRAGERRHHRWCCRSSYSTAIG